MRGKLTWAGWHASTAAKAEEEKAQDEWTGGIGHLIGQFGFHFFIFFFWKYFTARMKGSGLSWIVPGRVKHKVSRSWLRVQRSVIPEFRGIQGIQTALLRLRGPLGAFRDGFVIGPIGPIGMELWG